MTTHSWAYQPSHLAYRQAWPTIVGDARRIIDHVRRLGIVIAGPDGLRTPVLNQQVGIGFNGDASTDLAGEPFTLLAPDCPPGHPVATGTVTTNRKPYDLAVACVRLVNDRVDPRRCRRWRPATTPSCSKSAPAATPERR
jgi:hypothetical protein